MRQNSGALGAKLKESLAQSMLAQSRGQPLSTIEEGTMILIFYTSDIFRKQQLSTIEEGKILYSKFIPSPFPKIGMLSYKKTSYVNIHPYFKFSH
jgi:hypothetical protein